jgi:hypothetical protein
LPQDARQTIKEIIEPFADGGTDELENPNALQKTTLGRDKAMQALKATGKPPFEVLQEAKERLFAA